MGVDGHGADWTFDQWRREGHPSSLKTFPLRTLPGAYGPAPPEMPEMEDEKPEEEQQLLGLNP